MEVKVGDELTIRSDLKAGTKFRYIVNQSMEDLSGKKAKVTEIDEHLIKIDIDKGLWNWDLTMFEEFDIWLKDILESHKRWLHNKEDGKCANLKGINLSYINLNNVDLSYADLSNANLSYTSLSNAILINTNLINANLYMANLNSADLTSSDLKGANLYGVSLYNAKLRNVILIKTILIGANLTYADLFGSTLIEARLDKALLNKVDFRNTVLYETDLSYADLSESNLVGVSLYNTKLYNTDFDCVKMCDNDGHEIEIEKNFIITPIGSREDVTKIFITKDNKILIHCGCFTGYIDEFEKEVNETHSDDKYYRDQYLALIKLAKTMV